MSTITWDIRPVPGRRIAEVPSAHGLRLTRRGRAVVVGLALAIAAGVGLSAQSAQADVPFASTPVTPRTVSAGETLWAIAASITAPGEDVRDVVDALAALNGLDGAGLQAGQQILVPVTGGS